MSPASGSTSGPRLVAVTGDANDPGIYSGIPYFFLQAGRRAGLLDEGLDLTVDRPGIKSRRIAWNLARFLTGQGLGGFQYSDAFLEAMWAGHHPVRGSVVVNCFQLYPSSVTHDGGIERWFFIDQTLKQLFSYYEQGKVIGDRLARDAMARESVGYSAAKGIVVYSTWAKESVVNDYGVDPDRVQVVLLGPSLDPDKVERHQARPSVPPSGDPLRFIFVGKDWYAKGLDRILRALLIARRKGADIWLGIIGCRPEDIPERLRAVDGVEWLGFIDKRKEEDRFISVLCDAHVGVSLSRFEAGGIALREYLVLGLPTIGPATGGATEHLVPGASIGVSPEETDDEVAAIFFGLWRDRDRLGQMNQVAWERRGSVTWAASMDRFAAFWPHGGR